MLGRFKGFKDSIILHSFKYCKAPQLRAKIAFTLAEVLIVVGIMGIVAEMTIPTLVYNVSNLEYQTTWKKEYSAFANITQQILNENGGTFSGLLNHDDISMNNVFEKYLNIRTSCHTPGTPVDDICWHETAHWDFLNKIPVNFDVNGVSDLTYPAPGGEVLADGTLVRYLDYDCDTSTGYCGYILFDVNGFKKPNTMGKDIFGVFVFLKGIVPFGSPVVDGGIRAEGTVCDPAGEGFPCSATALYN